MTRGRASAARSPALARPPGASRAPARPRRVALVALVATWAIACASGVRAEENAPHPSPVGSVPAPARPKVRAGPIIPRPQAPAPRAFTLEDRYLDAARRGDLRMLKLCLDKGVAADAKDGFGRSALLLATRDGHSLDMVRFLRERGLAFDQPDVRGITPLGYAAESGQLALVQYLLELGAVVDRKDAQGQTPLFHAALAGHEKAVSRLIEAGADVDVQDRFRDTPLMGTCAKGYDDIARVLLAAGADPSRTDQEGRTARDRAAADSAFCRDLRAAFPAP